MSHFIFSFQTLLFQRWLIWWEKQQQRVGEIWEIKPYSFLEQRSPHHTPLKLCKVAQEDPQSTADIIDKNSGSTSVVPKAAA